MPQGCVTLRLGVKIVGDGSMAWTSARDVRVVGGWLWVAKSAAGSIMHPLGANEIATPAPVGPIMPSSGPVNISQASTPPSAVLVPHDQILAAQYCMQRNMAATLDAAIVEQQRLLVQLQAQAQAFQQFAPPAGWSWLPANHPAPLDFSYTPYSQRGGEWLKVSHPPDPPGTSDEEDYEEH